MQINENDRTMENKFIPMTSITSGLFQQVADGVYCQTIQIVNIAYVEHANGFVLIDTGMPQSSKVILKQIEEQFGKNAVPDCIILTHGHFDHVGAIEDLVELWNIPVYAHIYELPYLTGQRDYPEPDWTVEGGLLAKISPIYPNDGIDLAYNVQPLPESGEVPYLPDWQWLHTPGHTEGHISLFRENDRTLIAGDAFITVRQDSLLKVLVQNQEVSGPPRYLTPDWNSAWDSVKKLSNLQPQVALCGHGVPMAGENLQQGLENLVQNFDKIAIPDHGKYIN